MHRWCIKRLLPSPRLVRWHDRDAFVHAESLAASSPIAVVHMRCYRTHALTTAEGRLIGVTVLDIAEGPDPGREHDRQPGQAAAPGPLADLGALLRERS